MSKMGDWGLEQRELYGDEAIDGPELNEDLDQDEDFFDEVNEWEEEEDEWDGQPDEAQEWHDFDPDC
jgi:hypothetical protein